MDEQDTRYEGYGPCGERLLVLLLLATVAVMILACGDSVDSGSSGLVPRPTIDLTGRWTGAWEFRTCESGAKILQPCASDAECGGIAGSCKKPSQMCNAGLYTERACVSDADCPSIGLFNRPGPPIAGACVAEDFSGSFELVLSQAAPVEETESEFSARLTGTSLFANSPCWNPAQWDPSEPGYDPMSYPWDAPRFEGSLIGLGIDAARASYLKGDPNYVVSGIPQVVPDVTFVVVDLQALANRVQGTLSVPVVPRIIGLPSPGSFPLGPYDVDLAAEAGACEGRRGVLSATRP